MQGGESGDEPTGAPADDAAWAPPAAPPPAPPTPRTVEPLLPGYRDFVQVARGGDSVVYRAHQETVDRDVAVKVVELDDPATISRFKRELEITVRLGRQHPNIMTVLAVDTTVDGQPCLVMDYVELGSLHNRLAERGPLPVHEVVAAGSVIADALAFAHAQGVLHRDVKPQNVLVLPTSYVLADFGLARAIDAGHSGSLERFSYRHASPQILDGEPPTIADDVYSLGSTLFTLLDGRAPFAADDPDEDSALSYLRRARTEDPRPLERAGLPDALVDIVMRCLAKQREDRYPDAAALRDALDAVPTESRSWAPEASPAAPTSLPTAAPTPDREPSEEPAQEPTPDPTSEPTPEKDATPEPAPEKDAPAEPTTRKPVEPPASLPPGPEPVSVSALAHLTDDEHRSVHRDAESTGTRPAEPEPVAEPAPPRKGLRWLPLGIGTLAALLAGVLIGVLRDGGEADPGRSSSPRPTTSANVITVQPITKLPSGTTGTPVFDPSIRPTIIKAQIRGSRIDLVWTLPPAARSLPLLPFLVSKTGQRGPADNKTLPAGTTRATLTGLQTNGGCVSIAAITSDPDTGQSVFGLSNCVRPRA